MRETQDLVTIIPWTFIAQICNLFIQCWLIKKFLFKPVCAIIEKRRALADSQIQDAKKAKEEADAMKADYEAEMAKAKETANSILQNAQKDAAARSEAMIQEAQTQAAGIKAKAEADIAQEKKKAVNDIKNEIGGIAMDNRRFGKQIAELHATLLVHLYNLDLHTKLQKLAAQIIGHPSAAADHDIFSLADDTLGKLQELLNLRMGSCDVDLVAGLGHKITIGNIDLPVPLHRADQHFDLMLFI